MPQRFKKKKSEKFRKTPSSIQILHSWQLSDGGKEFSHAAVIDAMLYKSNIKHEFKNW